MKHTRKTAGRLGGLATVKKHGIHHMQEIGKRGARTMHEKYDIVPVKQGQYALIDRITRIIKAIF